MYNKEKNILNTIEAIAYKANIHLDVRGEAGSIDIDEDGNIHWSDFQLHVQDDEGNRWSNEEVFAFMNEFTVDASLISFQQAQQVNTLAHYFGEEHTYDWLMKEFYVYQQIADELVLEVETTSFNSNQEYEVDELIKKYNIQNWEVEKIVSCLNTDTENVLDCDYENGSTNFSLITNFARCSCLESLDTESEDIQKTWKAYQHSVESASNFYTYDVQNSRATIYAFGESVVLENIFSEKQAQKKLHDEIYNYIEKDQEVEEEYEIER